MLHTDLSAALGSFVRSTPRRGLVVVLSDFYDPRGYQEGLDLLRYHRFEPTIIQLWAKEEARPSLRGDLELYDVESGETRQVTVSERVLNAYAREHGAYCDRLAAFCQERAIAYYRADVSVPFDETVLRLFRQGGFLS